MIHTKELPPNDYPHNFGMVMDDGTKVWFFTLRWENKILKIYSDDSLGFRPYYPSGRYIKTYILNS